MKRPSTRIKPTTRWTVSFRVGSDSLDPDYVTRVLELEPNHSHRKGSRERVSTRAGTVVRKDPWQSGLWMLQSPLAPTEPIHHHLEWISKQLLPRLERLKILQDNGLQMDLFCSGTFPSDRIDSGFTLPHAVLESVANLGIETNVDVYTE